MRVSIVMATYNGAAYLPGQLASLAGQTRLADETVLFDDCSEDDTWRILRDYARDEPGVRLHVNEKNLGFRRNFHEALKACTGELIFLCDQDDLWAPEKLEIMSAIMESNPRINLLACNYTRLLQDGQELPHSVFTSHFRTLCETADNAALFQVKATTNLLDIPLPGCCYCVRGSFLKRCEPYWMEECPHDAVLWRYAALSDSVWIVDQPLVKWRKHASSAWRKETGNLYDRQGELKWREAEMRDLRDMTRFAEAEGISESYRRRMERNDRFASLRERFCRTRNPLFALALLRYLNLYPGVKAWVKDWLIAFH